MSNYNNAQYLSESIESILHQSHDNFEFIIIDDGSTDNSKEIIKEYADVDMRIKPHLHKINQGLVKCLNFGLKKSNGKYIARMDSDDISLPTRLETQLDFMEMHPEICLCGSAIEIFDANESRNHFYATDHNHIKLRLLLNSEFAHPTVMIKKSIFDDYSFFYSSDYPAAEDYDLWVRISEKCTVANIRNVLLKHRRHDQAESIIKNTLQTNSVKKIKSRSFDKLGVPYTEEKNAILKNIVDKTYRLELSFVRQAEKLLSEFAYANQSTNYFNDLFIRDYIQETWQRLTYGSTRFGLNFYQLFKNSSLTEWSQLSIFFKLKLLVKSLIKI
ncbi:MAG: glycosyltransferase [Cyclobacteriaceae bacterium]